MKRIPHIDERRTRDNCAANCKSIQEKLDLFRADPATANQSRYSFLSSEYAYLALGGYALGEDLSAVAANFREAVAAYFHVLRMRGTRPHPLVGSPPEAKEWSIGNSVSTFEVCAYCLLAGDLGLAEEMACKIWDPDDCNYFGWGSGCQTPNQQAMAYGFRSLMAGSPEDCLKEFRKLSR